MKMFIVQSANPIPVVWSSPKKCKDDWADIPRVSSRNLSDVCDCKEFKCYGLKPMSSVKLSNAAQTRRKKIEASAFAKDYKSVARAVVKPNRFKPQGLQLFDFIKPNIRQKFNLLPPDSNEKHNPVVNKTFRATEERRKKKNSISNFYDLKDKIFPAKLVRKSTSRNVTHLECDKKKIELVQNSQQKSRFSNWPWCCFQNNAFCHPAKKIKRRRNFNFAPAEQKLGTLENVNFMRKKRSSPSFENVKLTPELREDDWRWIEQQIELNKLIDSCFEVKKENNFRHKILRHKLKMLLNMHLLSRTRKRVKNEISRKNAFMNTFSCGGDDYHVVEHESSIDENSYYISVNDFLAMKPNGDRYEHGLLMRENLLRHFNCYHEEINFESVLSVEKLSKLLHKLERATLRMNAKTKKAFYMKRIYLGLKTTRDRSSPPVAVTIPFSPSKLKSNRKQSPKADASLTKIRRNGGGRPRKGRQILLSDGKEITVPKRGRLSKKNEAIAQTMALLAIPVNQKKSLSKSELESIRNICNLSEQEIKNIKLTNQPMSANYLYTILCYLATICSKPIAVISPEFSFKHFSHDFSTDQKESLKASDMYFGSSSPEVLLIPIACYNQDIVTSEKVGHWILGIFDVSTATVYYYDSNHIPLAERSDSLWNPERLIRKSISTFHQNTSQSEHFQNVSDKHNLFIQHSHLYYNQQLDNYSCGYFVSLYADLFINYDKTKMYLRNFDVSRQIDRLNNIVSTIARGEKTVYLPIPGSHCVNQWPKNPKSSVKPRPPLPVDKFRKEFADKLKKIKENLSGFKTTPCYHLDVNGVLHPCLCPYCTARIMLYEHKKLLLGRFTKCCALGQVQLLQEWNLRQMVPEEFEHLLTLAHSKYSLKALKEFLKFSLKYNNELAFGSIVLDKAKPPLNGYRAPVQLNGCSVYLLSGLLPPKDKNGNPVVERFGQVYYVEPEDVMQKRLEGQPNLQGTSWINVELLDELHRMMRACNPFAQLYYSAYQSYQKRLREFHENFKEGMVAPKLQMVILTNREVTDKMKKDILGGRPAPHPHRTEYPEVPNVGLIYDNSDGDPPNYKGVMLEGKDGETKMIHYSNPQVDPICFPLICPYGQEGYRYGMKLDGTRNTVEKLPTTKNIMKCSEKKRIDNQDMQDSPISFDKEERSNRSFWKDLQKEYKDAASISCYSTEGPIDIPLEHFLRMANDDEPTVNVAHKGWYDMETIDCYAQLIVREYPHSNYISMYVVDVLLRNHGDSMLKWAADDLPDWNPTQYTKLFMVANIPHEGDDFIKPKFGQNHWSAILADMSTKTIVLKDSLIQNKGHNANRKKYMYLMAKIICKMADFHNVNMHPSEWKMNIDFTAQQQLNGSDCGPFSLMQTVHFVSNVCAPFECSNITAARITMAKHLISQKIRNTVEPNIEQTYEAIEVPERPLHTAKKTVQPVQIPMRPQLTSEKPVELPVPVCVPEPFSSKQNILVTSPQIVSSNNDEDEAVEDSGQELSDDAESEYNNSLDDSFEFPNETTIIRDHCLLDNHMINVLVTCDHEGLGASELWSLGCSSAWRCKDNVVVVAPNYTDVLFDHDTIEATSTHPRIPFRTTGLVEYENLSTDQITADIKAYKNYSEQDDWKYAVIFVRPFIGHWTVAIAERDSNNILYYESIPERREYPLSDVVEARIKKAVQDLSTSTVNVNELSIIIMTENNINDQLDSVNCGFFAALHVEGFLNNPEHITKLENFDILQERQRLIRHLRELQRSDYGEYLVRPISGPATNQKELVYDNKSEKLTDVDPEKLSQETASDLSENDNCIDEDVQLPKAKSRIYVSQRRYTRYMLMRRTKNGYHHILGKGKLTQAYILHCATRIERHEIDEAKKAIRDNRVIYRGDLYRAISNRLKKHHPDAKLGRVMMDSVNVKGSRKYMQKAYADAMTIINKKGNPFRFVTFTGNPDWPEIKNNLQTGETWLDCPDLVCRVFIGKAEEFLKDVTQRKIFGELDGWIVSWEYQKRGMPHLHLLLIPKRDNPMLGTPQLVDGHISAEIPDLPQFTKEEFAKLTKIQQTYVEEQIRLHSLVCRHNIHVCSESAMCLVNGKCQKGFPKPFAQFTSVADNRYPSYCRRPPMPDQKMQKNNFYDTETVSEQVEQEPECTFETASSVNNVADEELEPITTIHNHHKQWEDAIPLDQDQTAYGNTYEKKAKNGTSVIVDNRHVVPYNAKLTLRYETHINVEDCFGQKCVNYVLKYITKGGDVAFVKVTPSDVAENLYDYDEYQARLVRFLTPSEAFMKIWSNPIVKMSHTVEKLFIHGPHGPAIIFEEGGEDRILNNPPDPKKDKSKLLGFFKLNIRRRNEGLPPLLYIEVNKEHWYEKRTGSWRLRKTGLSARSKDKRLARICAVNAKDANLTAIRNLLLFVRGPTGFTDLCRVNPEQPDQVAVGMPACKSFIESCFLRGISEDINLWLQTLNDAADEYGNPRRFRHFFAMTLFHSKPSRTQDIFNIMLDKLMLPANNKEPESAVAKFARRQKVLNHLEYIFRQMNSSCEEMGLESPLNYEPGAIEEELNKETWLAHVADCPDAPKLPTWMWYAERNLRKFNDGQKEAFDQIKKAIECDPASEETINRHFFLTGAGGTGKTFLYNTIIAWCKAKEIKVSSTATTGIAATLLINGGTLHSALRIGEDVDENAQPNINFESDYAKRLRDTRLFIIDEVSMLNKHNLEYLDRLLKSVSCKPQSYYHFAGKVVVLGGDWKQLMPVVQGGDVLDQYNATIKRSALYSLFQPLELTENMRLEPGEEEFAKKVYDTGMGKNYIEGTPYVRAHPDSLVKTVGAMLERIYPDAVLADPTNNTRAFAENAILCPRNSNVFALNQTIIEMLPGREQIYFGIDRVVREDEVDIFAVNAADKQIEHVHSLTPTGFPPHRLILKVGTPVMLIRNLDISNGLVNGTRMQVLKLGRNLLTCQILSGSLKGQVRCLQRVRFEYGRRAKETGIVWSRLQFPVRSSFVMTINKAQGQSLKRVGICLEHQQVFAHGQLYTAKSRVTTQAGLTILNAPLERADGTVVYDHLLNIVYRPVLDKDPVSSLAATCGEMSPERVRDRHDKNARIPRIPSYQRDLISSPAHAENVYNNDEQLDIVEFWKNRRLNEWQQYGIYRYAENLPMTLAHFIYSGLDDKLDAIFINPPLSYVAEDRVHFVQWRISNGLSLTREDCLFVKQDPDSYTHGIASEPYLAVEFGYGVYPVPDEEASNAEGDNVDGSDDKTNTDNGESVDQKLDLSQLKKGCSIDAHTANLADNFEDNSQAKRKVPVTAIMQPPVIDLIEEPEQPVLPAVINISDNVPIPVVAANEETTAQDIIRRVWADDPTIRSIATPFGAVSAYNLRTLMPGRELVAEMIDRYLELLQNTPRPADAARIGTVTVDFLVRYRHLSYAELIEVYPLRFDLLNVGIVLIPYFAGEQGTVGHYTFIAVYPGRRVVHQYNSISGVGDADFDLVLNLLQDHARALNQPFRRAEWTCANRASPQQRNGYDCGVFTAQFARHASTSTNDAVMSFTQRDIPRLRREMAEEIITGQLSWQPFPAVNNYERVRQPPVKRRRGGGITAMSPILEESVEEYKVIAGAFEDTRKSVKTSSNSFSWPDTQSDVIHSVQQQFSKPFLLSEVVEVEDTPSVLSEAVPVANEILSGEILSQPVVPSSINAVTQPISLSPISRIDEARIITKSLCVTPPVTSFTTDVEAAEIASPLVLDLSNAQQLPFKDRDVQTSYEDYQKLMESKRHQAIKKDEAKQQQEEKDFLDGFQRFLNRAMEDIKDVTLTSVQDQIDLYSGLLDAYLKHLNERIIPSKQSNYFSNQQWYDAYERWLSSSLTNADLINNARSYWKELTQQKSELEGTTYSASIRKESPTSEKLPLFDLNKTSELDPAFVKLCELNNLPLPVTQPLTSMAKTEVVQPVSVQQAPEIFEAQILPEDPFPNTCDCCVKKKLKKIEAKRNRWSFLPTKLKNYLFPTIPKPLPPDQAHLLAVHNAQIREQQLQERLARQKARPKKMTISKYESLSKTRERSQEEDNYYYSGRSSNSYTADNDNDIRRQEEEEARERKRQDDEYWSDKARREEEERRDREYSEKEREERRRIREEREQGRERERQDRAEREQLEQERERERQEEQERWERYQREQESRRREEEEQTEREWRRREADERDRQEREREKERQEEVDINNNERHREEFDTPAAAA